MFRLRSAVGLDTGPATDRSGSAKETQMKRPVTLVLLASLLASGAALARTDSATRIVQGVSAAKQRNHDTRGDYRGNDNRGGDNRGGDNRGGDHRGNDHRNDNRGNDNRHNDNGGHDRGDWNRHDNNHR